MPLSAFGSRVTFENVCFVFRSAFVQRWFNAPPRQIDNVTEQYVGLLMYVKQRLN